MFNSFGLSPKIEMNGNEYGENRCSSRHRLTFREHQLTTAEFIEYFSELDTKQTVLDVGCGDGFFMEILRNLGFDLIYGIDVSQPLLATARRKGLRVVEGSVYDLTASGEVDVILLCDVLEHLENPGLAITKIYDALKEEGILYLIAPVYDSISNRLVRLFKRKKRIQEERERDQPHLHALSTNTLVWLLKSHRFTIEKNVHTANRLPGISGKTQQYSFGGRHGNWVSIVARKRQFSAYQVPALPRGRNEEKEDVPADEQDTDLELEDSQDEEVNELEREEENGDDER